MRISIILTGLVLAGCSNTGNNEVRSQIIDPQRSSGAEASLAIVLDCYLRFQTDGRAIVGDGQRDS